ncbi:MAG: 2-oxoacid:ferredoxin oxidoreductase subunit alpha [Nitrospirae bacterium GWC2_57_13]|jgi:2-oxoglutarate/2-oxoacid ferredoxin oxidoreductase subunit alpha|nr:MAG: 2-oxoacid:ferredoxin oxidoreductase subunit alpha [Nitrospirae bacterium GWC2_57_13]OGW46654.1 MAG: 2-oxoacid:ferredoxin oxidoreductase subunit alpha [Nitrospirae bacterium GWD2_57_8]
MDYTIRIGGAAGQGIQTIGETLGRVFVRTGYFVFTHQDYESRVRGGHNFYQIRVSTQPVYASRDGIDILVALDSETIPRYEKERTRRAQVVYDSSALKKTYEGPAFIDIPFAKLAKEHGGSPIMANTVATGAVLGMLGMELDALLAIIAETFGKKGEAVVSANRKAAQAGHELAVEQCVTCSFAGEKKDTKASRKKRLLIAGIETIALGAIAGGCRFYAAYPMTPSTGIMNYIASKAEQFGIVVEQAEDEIAAINMALGASFAGVRAMTGTSGGGFALMVEGLSLAGITETPVVIAMGQRPGPATGLPTRTEQGELQFLVSAGHGEFPRIIFAPGTPVQALLQTARAFDLAEKYQIPVFILFDQYLADSQWTYEDFDLSKVKYTDYRLRGEAFSGLAEYQRHAYTANGVTPLGVPGDAKHLVVTDSDEHDEAGHIVEDGETRNRMVEKRLLKKLPRIQKEIAPPLFYGDLHPEVVITCWGSTYGVLREAVDELSATHSAAMLHFSEVFPLPAAEASGYLSVLKKAGQTICIENNATGQFERLLRAETGFVFSGHVRRYDGRPFTVDSLVKELKGKIKRR